MLNRIIATTLLLALAGCGFQLRGSQQQFGPDLGPLRVVSKQPESDLGDLLGRALSGSGAESSQAGQPASALTLLSERWTDRSLTVDSTAQVREFITTYTVEFELTDADGKVRVPSQQVILDRVYTFDVEASGGTPAERILIREELSRDMIGAIIRRLSAALRASG